jgi:hypothetical protein
MVGEPAHIFAQHDTKTPRHTNPTAHQSAPMPCWKQKKAY